MQTLDTQPRTRYLSVISVALCFRSGLGRVQLRHTVSGPNPRLSLGPLPCSQGT